MKKILPTILFSLIALPLFATAQTEPAVSITNQFTTTASTQSGCVDLQNNMGYQSRDISTNGEVSSLQDFLASNNYLASEPTGYFGSMTTVAVKKFQSAVGIADSATLGYGGAGPLTRGKIKAMTCGGISVAAAPQGTVTSSSVTPAPAVALTAIPTSIASGQPVTLTLSSTNAAGGCSGVNVSDGKTSGTNIVYPTQTTTYSVACYELPFSGGRSAFASVTVLVTSVPTPAGPTNPTVSLSRSNQMASIIDAFGGSADKANSNAVSAPVVPSFSYNWTHDLQIGSSYTADITALQTALNKQGIFTGEVSGNFYDKTFAAVKQFQQKYGISTTGFVGPTTRAKLSELYR